MKSKLSIDSTLIPPPAPRFLIADDHAVVRMGLREVIGRIDRNIQVDEVSTVEAIITKLRSERFGLLILDINMRRLESFGLMSHLRSEFPSLKILIYTAHNEDVFATRYLRWGVYGYLPKQSDESEIVKAIEAVRKGNIYFSNTLSRMISSPSPASDYNPLFSTLTDREFQVFLQLLKGYSPEEIARMLHLNRSTVGTHKYRILSKLRVKNTAELVELAQGPGVI